MTEQKSLDDSSYEEIYEKAIQSVHRQAPWWSHTEVSDPGITLLEMWALLSDMQSFYLNQVQESHYRKYLKLLGICPDKGKCASTWVFFENVTTSRVVPQGTKLLSDRIVFETEEEVMLVNNKIVEFYQSDGINRADVMNLRRKSSFLLCKEKEQILFSLKLEKSLEPGKDFRFFVLLDERKKRNAGRNKFYMAQLAWEYEEDGKWHEAQVIRDDTQGLLFSGCICIRIKSAGNKGEYRIDRIRCRIKEGEYDVMPVLYKICLNFVRVFQKNTLCCEETLEFTKKRHRIPLKSYLARIGNLRILKKKGRDLWEDITDSKECGIDPPITAECMERYITFTKEGCLKVICMADEAKEELTGTVTGITSQKIVLPWDKVMRSRVRLMIRQDSSLFRTYYEKEPEEERYAYAWHWKEKENIIVLGDGRHGEIPPASQNGLQFTSVVLCEGKKGNVSVGRIKKWEKEELFPGINCINRFPGRGGRDREQPAKQFEGIKKMLLRQNRMVTGEDIEQLVKETPGLIIKDVKTEWKDKKAVITVIPQYKLKSDYCVRKYRQQVEQHLEKFRLAGTALEIEIG